MKKVVDLSVYNGLLDFNRLKAEGVEGCVLKVIDRQNRQDKRFADYLKLSKNAGIELVGVYNYTYATTIAMAEESARSVCKILLDNKLKTTVFLDVEDKIFPKQESVSLAIINAYKRIIISAGHKFAIYTGLSYYNTYFSLYMQKELKNVPFWIARYPHSNPMKLADKPIQSKKPVINNFLCGWQYTSNGNVNGATCRFDFNEWYGLPEEEKQKEQVKITVPSLRDYRGESLTTGFELNGCKGDLKTRSVIAKFLGIKDYTGTITQNMEMLAKLRMIENAFVLWDNI